MLAIVNGIAAPEVVSVRQESWELGGPKELEGLQELVGALAVPELVQQPVFAGVQRETWRHYAVVHV